MRGLTSFAGWRLFTGLSKMLDSMVKRRPVGKKVDRRAQWNNSPEARQEVKRLLTDWADAVRGGFPPLGYPSKQPFAVSPESPTKRFDVDEVQAVSDTMMLWRLIQDHIGDEERRAHLIRLFSILRVEFIASGAPQEAKAKRFKITRRHYSRLLGEALYRFWVLHQ